MPLNSPRCIDVGQLLRGRSFSDIGTDLSELWRLCFLVMDDIKACNELIYASNLR